MRGAALGTKLPSQLIAHVHHLPRAHLPLRHSAQEVLPGQWLAGACPVPEAVDARPGRTPEGRLLPAEDLARPGEGAARSVVGTASSSCFA